MKISNTLLVLFFLFFTLNASYSQITCTQELNTLAPADINNSNWVVPSTGITCVSSNLTINYLEIANGGTLIIKAGAKLTINNGIRPDNIASRQSTIEVYGEISSPQSITIPMSTKLTVHQGGVFNSGNVSFKGNSLTLINKGTINIGGINFDNNSSINTIDNQGTLNITSNINVAGNSTSNFRNSGNLNISATFNNNANSVYVNCGNISTGGFNLGGGKIYNSGVFNASGNINFGANTALLENYGTFNGSTIQLGGGTSYVYNSGNFSLSDNFQNDGHLKGPTSGTNYGKFTLKNKAGINNGSVTGKLNFISTNGTSTQAAMFNNTVSIANTVVFGSCPTCTVITTGATCLNPNGTLPTCTQPGTEGTPDNYTRLVISNLETTYLNLPIVFGVTPGQIPNGFIALESKTKGLVITRVANSTAIADPKKGMLIYDIAAACVKLYNGTFWNCIEKSCNN